MKNSKYIKVSVSEKNEGQTLICVNESGIISIGKIHQSRLDYSFTCISSIQGKQTYSYDIKHYLKEVPDYEDEMKEMLEFIYGYGEKVQWPKVRPKLEELLTKLKT
ncbi:hypothetical protein [Chryseobacterium sp. 2VB]|uniref:hypothetical protein n=1 Tax=Chryseobacterium sp. 2VB TaxID=2502204 RepID=UPI0010F72582|nr:hypothetical protein [Chryseobacterium sp. 2VB]